MDLKGSVLMIEIDGSFGEGGGAILRVATALSALTGKALALDNIRSKRTKPGLMPQHLNAARALARLSQAEVTGLELGSTQMTFKPGPLQGGKLEVDVQTAGSVSLILQALMIPSFFVDSPLEITITGGTDVRWAPPFDYLQHVTLPVLKSMGLKLELKLIQRGYYPRGGGTVHAGIDGKQQLQPVNLYDLEIDCIRGISHSSQLPRHVAERQARAAQEKLSSAGYPVEIEVKHDNSSPGPGSALVLWTEVKNSNVPRVGASSLGKPGKKAEIVGKEAACDLLQTMETGAALDRYMGDQIIPYIALAGSSSVKVSQLTPHTLTNIHVCQKFTDRKFQVDGRVGEVATITVD
jgi:RNA 3'-terminal phosphate cyclase (ATP)